MSQPNNPKRHLIVVLVIFTILLVLNFQNCSLLNNGQNDHANDFAAKGNGEGYSGKVYVNRTSTGTCSDGSTVNSQIVIDDNGNASLTRENCQDLTQVKALDFSSLGLLPHNVLNLTHENHVFDDIGQVTTGLFCRPDMFISPGALLAPPLLPIDNTYPAGTESLVTDFVLKNFHVAVNQVFPGRVIIGEYDRNKKLLGRIDSGDIDFHPISTSQLMPEPLNSIMPGRQLFSGQSTDGVTSFELAVMSSIDGSIILGEVRFKKTSETFASMALGLQCYTQ